MRKCLALFLLLCVSLITLSGCVDPEMERQTFAICMSLDQADNGITLAIQAPKNGQVTTDGNPQNYEIISVTAVDLISALHLLSVTTPYPINYSQMRIIVFSNDVVQNESFYALLTTLESLRTMRAQATLLISVGDAQDILKKQTPDFGMRLSTHLDTLFSLLQAECILPVCTLSECIRDLRLGQIDPLITVCAVNPSLDQDSQSSSGSSDQSGGDSGGASPAMAIGEPWNSTLLPSDLQAGMLPRTGENPVEMIGAVALSGGKPAGVLTASECQLSLLAIKEATMRISMQEDTLQLQLLIPKTSLLMEDLPALESLLAKLLAMNVDALGFGEQVAMLFTTDDDFLAYDFSARYQSASVVVLPQ